MDTELILALAGIAFAVISLGALSIYQQARIGREKRAKAEAVRVAAGDAVGAPAGATPFFIARYRGNKARFFRVYSDESALLFLDAGPFVVMVDAETPRGTDPRHWAARSARLLAAGLGVGAVAAVGALVVIVRGLARDANRNPEAAGSILIWTLGIIALLAVVFVIAVPAVVWRIARRAAELDALTLGQLRERAATDDRSFRVAAGDLADVRFEPLEMGSPLRPSTDVGATLRFRHAPTGKWKVETTTARDTADAVGAFRRLLGEDAVAVSDELATDLKAGRKEPEVKPARRQARRLFGPTSMNGCGTMVCEARGIIDWGDGSKLEDSDSIEAVTLLYIPLVPYRAVHTTGWHWAEPGPGMVYRRIPIRWSWGLWAAAFLRVAYRLVMLAGIIVILGGVVIPGTAESMRFENGRYVGFKVPTWMGTGYHRLLVLAAGGLVVGASVASRWALNRADRRDRDIRLVLGRHPLGSSDPATWKADLLRQVRSAERLFGAQTYAEAAPELLAQKQYGPAMFAARLAAARENRRAGDRLTDSILAGPELRAILEPLRREPARRAELLGGDDGWDAAGLFDWEGDKKKAYLEDPTLS